MKIYSQVNNNDCGIAVTQSLIKYFFKKEVSKDQLYQDANLKEEGLSILDLELLNEKYGIKLQSYSMPFEEFVAYETKKYFLLVINRNNEQHYTIAKKKGNTLTLFDPALGKVKVSLEKAKEFWLDIFITIDLINKEPIKTPKPKEQNTNKSDLFQVFSLFLVNLVVLLLSFFNTYLVKYSFNHVFNNHDFYNLLKVLIVNLIFCAIFHFGEFLESIMIFKHKIQYFKALQIKFLDSLKTKKNSYFQKLGKNQFLLSKDHIDCIATYQSEYINKWMISCFSLFIASALLLYVSIYFFILIILSGLFQFICWKLTKIVYQKTFPLISEIQNDGKKISFSLESFLNKETNISKLSSLIKKSKNNWFLEASSQSELYFKQHLYSKFNSFLNNLIYVFVFALVAYYIMLGDLTFGHLMVMNLLYLHLNKSMGSLIGYYAFRTKYEYSREIYSQLINVDSFEVETVEEIKLPEAIQIKNLFFAVNNKVIFSDLNLNIKPSTLICGPSGSGKSVLYKLLIRKLNPSVASIYFDEQEISSIEPTTFRDMCIYQVSDSYTNSEDLDSSNFQNLDEELKNEILNICQIMNLNPNSMITNIEQLSSGQRQLINILSLLNTKNKVLFLDEIASHINIEARILVYKHLIPYISESNFVLCSEHSQEIIPLFKNVIHLCPQ